MLVIADFIKSQIFSVKRKEKRGREKTHVEGEFTNNALIEMWHWSQSHYKNSECPPKT